MAAEGKQRAVVLRPHERLGFGEVRAAGAFTPHERPGLLLLDLLGGYGPTTSRWPWRRPTSSWRCSNGNSGRNKKWS